MCCCVANFQIFATRTPSKSLLHTSTEILGFLYKCVLLPTFRNCAVASFSRVTRIIREEQRPQLQRFESLKSRTERWFALSVEQSWVHGYAQQQSWTIRRTKERTEQVKQEDNARVNHDQSWCNHNIETSLAGNWNTPYENLSIIISKFMRKSTRLIVLMRSQDWIA